ncbi:MAG: hypothetical protein GY907_08585 [Bacteroidetes bacterium]|nr:hypothetical protein [Bacteroidota bacterium]
MKPLLYVKNRLPEPEFSDSEEEGKTVKEWDSEEDYKSDDSEEVEKNTSWFSNQATARNTYNNKKRKKTQKANTSQILISILIF